MFQLQDFPDPARVHLQPLKTPEHIHTVLLDDDDDDGDKHQDLFDSPSHSIRALPPSTISKPSSVYMRKVLFLSLVFTWGS